MKTVGKNTKEFKKATIEAKGVSVYRLEHDFRAQPVHELPVSAIQDGKLVKGNGTYSLRVHSNLWYEWSVA